MAPLSPGQKERGGGTAAPLPRARFKGHFGMAVHAEALPRPEPCSAEAHPHWGTHCRKTVSPYRSDPPHARFGMGPRSQSQRGPEVAAAQAHVGMLNSAKPKPNESASITCAFRHRSQCAPKESLRVQVQMTLPVRMKAPTGAMKVQLQNFPRNNAQMLQLRSDEYHLASPLRNAAAGTELLVQRLNYRRRRPPSEVQSDARLFSDSASLRFAAPSESQENHGRLAASQRWFNLRTSPILPKL